MSLTELHKGARIIETIENYARADEIISGPEVDNIVETLTFYEDEKFWRYLRTNPNRGLKVNLFQFVISDWVARVPGLYWSPSSQSIRLHKAEDIELQSEEWTVFQPIGKSKKVLGGIGTLMLPPTDDGKILVSASAACNASSGIPLLLYPDVYEQLKIKQGDCIIVKEAKWQPMDLPWASRFASTKDTPRGYLVIDSVNKLVVEHSECPVVYHPFSLMEYEHQDSLFYDFVYVTADSKVEDVDVKIESFFDEYAKANGRHGEYLLNPNVVKPIFQSRYLTPAELTGASEKAKVSLMYERIRETHFQGYSIEQLAIKLPQLYQSSKSIQTLAKNIGINVAFLQDDSATNMVFQLIDLCLKKSKMEELIDRVSLEYPKIFH